VTRIIAGTAAGRRLSVPKEDVRPTTDRVREALFSSLTHTRGSLSGDRVLDLYAGTGALGLEALSRGARHLVAVERSPATAAALRRNVDVLRDCLASNVTVDVIRADVLAWLSRVAQAPFDVVFADPPYGVSTEEVERVLSDLISGGLLSAGADVVIERGRRDRPMQWPAPLQQRDTRRYGDTTLWYGRAQSHPEPTP